MNDSNSFVNAMIQLSPWLDNKSKKEMQALQKLYELYPNRSLSEIVSLIENLLKFRRLSPEGFADRVHYYLNNSWPNDEPIENSAALISDFKKLNATSIKSIGKILKINIENKNDFEAFAHWLQTGVKPPDKDEKIRSELQAYAQKALQLRNLSIDELSAETIDSIIKIAKEVQQKFKCNGLKLFVEIMGYPPKQRSAKLVLTMLEQRLQDLAMARFKAKEIDNLGRF